MKSCVSLRAWVALVTLLTALTLWSTRAAAMPSYARQTGLDCNSCHIGFDPVPQFTRTGRLFIMRGFHQPNSTAGKLREGGFDASGKDTPQYGGNYLALNWLDFFSARFVSDLAVGGSTPGTGKNLDVTSNAGARLSMFFTGPVTDWLGLWTEIGYLGNNALKATNSSTTAGQAPGVPTNLNTYAFDEYRLTASRMVGKDSFVAFSVGNEYPDAINEFVFPLYQVKPWAYGQGGVGKEYSTTAFSLLGFWNDSILTQYSAVTGDADNNWSNGHNNYVALAYDGIPGTGSRFRRESNDLWWVVESVWGSNVGSQVNPARTSLLCTKTCPPGISDTNLSFTNTIGYQWNTLGDLAAINGTGFETVNSSTAWRFSIHQAVADMGNHSWYQSLAIGGMHQSYVSGASSNEEKIGYTMTYFFNRTYGVGVYANRILHYDYTTPAGTEFAAYSPNIWGTELIWVPAMNINVTANYAPSITPVLVRSHYQGGGSNWSVLVDYGF